MILGVDPGLTGALALYDPAQNRIVRSFNVPVLTIERNKKARRNLDVHSLVNLVKDILKVSPSVTAWIEDVGANPKDGKVGCFTFGWTTGSLYTTLVALGIPVSKVPPVVWKKKLGCTADKDMTLLRASQLMPASVPSWTPVRNERDKEDCKGIAEAALIAYYGAKNLS